MNELSSARFQTARNDQETKEIGYEYTYASGLERFGWGLVNSRS